MRSEWAPRDIERSTEQPSLIDIQLLPFLVPIAVPTSLSDAFHTRMEGNSHYAEVRWKSLPRTAKPSETYYTLYSISLISKLV